MEDTLVVALKERVMLVSAEITSNLADKFCKGLNRLAAGGSDPVRCYVRSHGGELGAALYVMQLIDRAPFPVDLVALKRVASAGLLLMQCGRNAYSAGQAEFDFHRTHESYRLKAAGADELILGWKDVTDDMSGIVVYDAVMLQRLLRRADPREILRLFRDEATIDAQRAKSIHLISGHLSSEQVRADQRAIRRAMRSGSR